jgi:hypothetical protein
MRIKGTNRTDIRTKVKSEQMNLTERKLAQEQMELMLKSDQGTNGSDGVQIESRDKWNY